MKTLEDIQKRFENATEKEQWKKLKDLLFSEDKESVVMGMNLLETLDEEVYYDGVCSFLEDDGKGNWTLNAALSCEHELALKVEILRMAEEACFIAVARFLANFAHSIGPTQISCHTARSDK